MKLMLDAYVRVVVVAVAATTVRKRRKNQQQTKTNVKCACLIFYCRCCCYLSYYYQLLLYSVATAPCMAYTQFYICTIYCVSNRSMAPFLSKPNIHYHLQYSGRFMIRINSFLILLIMALFSFSLINPMDLNAKIQILFKTEN